MINGHTVLAIIPARGGSKGVPRKNIRSIAGKPLIAWTIEEAKKSKYIDRLILSSEDEEIISVAKEWGCDIPFIRPKELAADDTPGILPVLHAINTLPHYDYILQLQPTSPLRTHEDIDHCVEFFETNQFESCVSLVEVDKPPHWMYTVNHELKLSPFVEGETIVRRQDSKKIYSLNGAIYIAKKEFILQYKTFVTKETGGFIMDKEHSFDIDSELDFIICDFLLKKNK